MSRRVLGWVDGITAGSYDVSAMMLGQEGKLHFTIYRALPSRSEVTPTETRRAPRQVDQAQFRSLRFAACRASSLERRSEA